MTLKIERKKARVGSAEGFFCNECVKQANFNGILKFFFPRPQI